MRERIVRSALVTTLVVAVLLSLGTGHYAMPLDKVALTVWQTLCGTLDAQGQLSAAMLYQVRMPRIILAALVGAGLAASGAAYQGLLRNPLVAPDILGVSSGASLGAVIGIFFGLSTWIIQGLSFAFGLVAVFLVMGAARGIGRDNGNLVVMILCGVVSSSLFSACVSLITYLANTDTQLPAITYWLMGSFAKTSSVESLIVLGVVFLLGAVPLLCLRWRLTALSFGDEEAASVGVDVKRVRAIVICCATLLTSVSVSFCGVVGWVGLVVPHMVRLLSGPNYRTLMPDAMIGGAAFMVIVDIFARLSSVDLPLSVLTALIGAPLFIWMLFKGRRDWL